MDVEKILTDLKKGQGTFPPCYLLYGEEEYLIKDTLDRIIAIILPASDRELNLFFMEGENEDIDILCETILTPPLIPGKKIVVLRNTRLFQSRRVLPEIIQQMRSHFEKDPVRAARYFMYFLKITGWNIDDLRDDKWRKITDDDWKKTVEEDSGHDREIWLPGIIEVCVSRGMDVSQIKDDAESLEDILKRGIPEGNHLIMTAETVDKRKRLFRIISEIGIVLHLSKMKGEVRQKNALMDAAKDLLAKTEKKLTSNAWMAIGKKTDFNLADSMGAIEKLIAYTGERMLIDDSDVEEVVGKTKEDTVFDLTRALVDKDLNMALLNLKDLFYQGVNHLLILSMIAREIRFLFHAKTFIRSGKLSSFHVNLDYDVFQKSCYPLIRELTGDAGRKEGRGDLGSQHPYVIYNALKNSYRFSYEHLMKYLEDLVDMDIIFKTTVKDPRLLLERFIVNMCS
jgi:DNA polymerase-3 subunit delta